MKNMENKSRLELALVIALLLGGMTVDANAQIDRAQAGFLTDSSGGVVRSGFGLCWRAGTDPTKEQSQLCDPNYLAPAVKVAAQPPRPRKPQASGSVLMRPPGPD